MKDTIITIVIAVATFCLVAVCIFFIIEVIEDTIKERKAWKRREELIKKWAKMDLNRQCIYIDTDSTYYKGGYTHSYNAHSYNVWSKMRTSCWHLYDKDMCYCHADDFNYCNYKRCPLIHEEKDNGN